MRKIVLVFLFAWLAAPALAAPTCLDRHGDTIRCGVAGAMPVGWTLPPQERWDREISRLEPTHIHELLEVLAGIALFLAFIALLPEFDSTKDWDKQESDDDR